MGSVRNTASNYDRFLYKLVDEDLNINDQNLATKVGGLIKTIYVNDSRFVDNLARTIQVGNILLSLVEPVKTLVKTLNVPGVNVVLLKVINSSETYRPILRSLVYL